VCIAALNFATPVSRSWNCERRSQKNLKFTEPDDVAMATCEFGMSPLTVLNVYGSPLPVQGEGEGSSKTPSVESCKNPHLSPLPFAEGRGEESCR
jgi:hypothetical protein